MKPPRQSDAIPGGSHVTSRPLREIQADDLDRAKTFYGTVFGWTFADYSAAVNAPYFGVITGSDDEPGINGGLLPRPAESPGPGFGATAFVCTIGVEDYDATDAAILGAGGRVALPKIAIPGMAWQGYFLDTEGNTFGIHQPDPDAG